MNHKIIHLNDGYGVCKKCGLHIKTPEKFTLKEEFWNDPSFCKDLYTEYEFVNCLDPLVEILRVHEA